ncbi:MAG: glycosyltransferase family 2 protein [Burkholderiales bacterium]
MSGTRAPLSVTLIALNAERSLAAALDSVRFADEILVVDSGSSDATAEIALAHNAIVIRQPWLGYGPQKQFAVNAASHDWVLCIDADEAVSPALRQSIEAALAAPHADGFAFARCNRFLGRWLRHGEGYPDWSVRLFDRRHARWSDDPVHERVITTRPVARLAGDLLHDSAETLTSYLAKQDRYVALQADALRDRGPIANIGSMIGSPVVRFVKFYFLRAGFLDGWAGLVHIAIGCRNSFLKYRNALFGAPRT